jgi:hypothetical protein
LILPGGDLTADGVDVGESSRQTLTGQDRQFAFGDVEPAAALRRVVELEPRREETPHKATRPRGR